MCAITHATDIKENGVSLKTVCLMERNWPWVSEVAWVLRKKNPACTLGNSFHCTAERGCSRAWGGQTDIRMTLLKNVPVPSLELWHFSAPSLGTATARQISSHLARSTVQPGAHCRAMPKAEKEGERTELTRPRHSAIPQLPRATSSSWVSPVRQSRDLVKLANLFPTQQVLVFWDLVLGRKEYES